MVADELDYVVGVDPHRDRHALAVVGVPNGQVLAEATAAASSGGYRSVLRLAEQHAPGRRAFAIEGTGSYGKGLARFLNGHGERVIEVREAQARRPLKREDRRARRGPRGSQRARPGQAGATALGRQT